MLYFSHSRGLFSFKPIAVCTHTQIAPCMPGTSPWVSPVTLSPSFWPGEPRQSLTETRREAGSRASSSLGWDIPLRPCFSESCCLTLPRLWTCLLDEWVGGWDRGGSRRGHGGKGEERRRRTRGWSSSSAHGWKNQVATKVYSNKKWRFLHTPSPPALLLMTFGCCFWDSQKLYLSVLCMPRLPRLVSTDVLLWWVRIPLPDPAQTLPPPHFSQLRGPAILSSSIYRLPR